MAPKPNPYEQDLDKTAANYVAADAALVHRARGARLSRTGPRSSTATQRYTWSETYARCRRLASALAQRGIGAATRSR